MKRRVAGLLVLAAATLLGVGCGRSSLEPSGADGPPLQATLSTNVIRVGDVATLSVRWTHDPDATPHLPDLSRHREVVILGADQRVTPTEDGRVQTLFELRLTSFQPGQHGVYTGEVSSVTPTGSTNTYTFPEVTFDVASVLTGEETLQPARSLKRWPGNPWPWVIALATALALALAAAAAGIYFLRRRSQRPAPPAPVIPPDVVARRALERLHGRGYIEALLHEPFYVELSGIVRHYLEDRFALHAPEQTTEEFIREAAAFPGLDADHRRVTGDFLEQSDLVKFARHQPGSEDMTNAFSAAERLVEETREEGPTP